MKISNPHAIPFGLNRSGKAIAARDAVRGEACDCTCPGCGGVLIARIGEIRVPHFAHKSGAACQGALESSLHAAVKQVIAEELRLSVPRCSVFRHPGVCTHRTKRMTHYVWDCYAYGPGGEDIGPVWEGGYWSIPSARIKFDEVLVERNDGDIRPDLIGLKNGKRLFIEVAVTHVVDRVKLAKIRSRDVPTIEIVMPYDGSEVSWNAVREIVLNGLEHKRWVFHPGAERGAEADYQEKHEKRMTLAQQEEAERKMADRLSRDDDIVDQEMINLDRLEKSRIQEQQRLKERNKALRRAELEHREFAKRLAEKIKEEQAARERADAEAAAELARRRRDLREAKPSSDLPVGTTVLFLDLDGVLKPNSDSWDSNISILANALDDRVCSVVVTSEIRHHAQPSAVMKLLEPLGGRHVSFTPVLDKKEPYGTRAREIELWLNGRGQPRPAFMVLDMAEKGFRPGWTLMTPSFREGFRAEDGRAIRCWLDPFNIGAAFPDTRSGRQS